MQKPRWETPTPKGVKGSYGPLVVEWADRELGLQLDEWQQYVLTNALRYDRNGDILARTAMWSTARQNGKSVIVRAFYGWLLDPDGGGSIPQFASWEAITAAAHDAKQARIIYRGVYKDLKRIKRLTHSERQPHRAAIPPLVKLTLQAGIQGERMTFDITTAEADSARGNSFGAIAWDEVLTQKTGDMFESLKPTQMMQRSPIMLLTSTAGYPDSVVLREFYDRLRRQAVGDEAPDPTFYGAWWESEDPDAGLDWRAIKQANPSPRLPKPAVESEHRMFSPDQWRRERLNHWIDVKAPGAFNMGLWAKVREFGEGSPLDGLHGPYALGIREHPGWLRASIAIAGVRDDGRIGVEMYRDIRGTDDAPVTASRIIREVDAFPEPASLSVIAYDMASGAASEFKRHGEETGQPWDELKPAAVVSACMDFSEMVQAARLACNDPLIEAQIVTAATRPVGQDGAFRFSVRDSLGPIDAVLASTFAAHAIAYKPPPLQIFM